MGILDLELMFDLLDTDMRGYLTSNQLQDFHESLYFSPIDSRQIEAAIRTVCGDASHGLCPREHFTNVLNELDRRKALEEKVYWDFKTVDVEGKGRISLKTALLLFKAVHNELFSMKTWRSFLSQREYPDSDVCFDEIKMFLCNLVDGGPCDEEEFSEEEKAVSLRCCNNEYENLKELEKLQEDEASLAAEERERMHQANKLKQEAERRIKRLDHEGVVALLHEDEEWVEKAAKKARHKVTATDLMQALQTKYDILRDKLLLEMLKHHIGEGMWTVLSEDEQQERFMQLKMRFQRLLKDGKLDSASRLPGAGLMYSSNLQALMGFSRIGEEIQQIKESAQIKQMEKDGKTNKEIEEELLRLREEAVEGHCKSEELLVDLEKRYSQDKEKMSSKLKGANSSTMATEEKLTEYGLMIREQIRAREEAKFNSAALSVGIAERLKAQVQRPKEDRKRQEQLGKERLQHRKGKKLPRNWKGEELNFIAPGEAGLVDVLEDTVRALERKHAMERELLIFFLQGRDSVQARSAAKKLSADERSNQLLVLRTQQQGWRNQSSTERLVSKERHYAVLQEAAGLVVEDRRADMRAIRGASPDDLEVAADIMADLQHQQEVESHMLLSLHSKDIQELFRLRQQEHTSWQEELLDGISAVLLGTEENVSQEDELLKALEDKYDALRDKLLLEALEKQMGAAEWAKLSEQERQARLAKLKLQERRLRQQGRFDDAAALLGEGLKNAETLQALLGENRQRYLERLKERLERRQRRQEEGLDPDEEDEETLRLLNEEEAASTGNILRDLQNRFDEEKEALLRRLQEEQDRLAAEKRRQAELARLRREKRQAERESKFDEAALVLGLAERNRQNLEERLRRDRERQEQLARERLARRKRRGKPEDEEDEDELDPEKDDIQGWQDAVLKSLEKKHRAEQEFLMALLQDESSQGMRDEARAISEDDRLKRLSELKGKREELDLGVKADQLLHVDILDMASAYKFEVQRYRLANEKETDVNDEEVTVSIMADLQEEQDKESEGILAQLQEKSQAELSALKQKQEQERKDEVVENVATVLLEYDGTGSDQELVKALDQKYDALKDKLLLEALKKQLGDAEWAALSEQERQKRLVKLKLEERRLRKEGQLDELHRLLGEGFEMDANLRKLMGENKARYEEKLKERLARRRERLAQGLPVDDEDEEDIEDGVAEGEEVTDVKAILEDLDKRYEEEKEALMRRLQGQDERFMSEKQRQAELARLKREKLKAKQEDKFTTAALVLGLAEKQKAAVQERLKQDRLRQEQLARERLAQLRDRRKAKEQEAEDKLVTDGDTSVLQEAVMKALEHKHQDERQALLDVLQQDQPELADAAATMTQQQRENWLQQLSKKMNALDPADKETRQNLLQEAAVFKVVNRQKYLETLDEEQAVEKDDVIVSLLADLQQEQDQESEKLVNEMQDKDKTELVQLQENLFQSRKDGTHQNVTTVVTQAEIWGTASERELSQALHYKYDALKDKLLRDALIQQVGVTEWAALSENDRFTRLAQMKLKVQALQEEGKHDELQQLLGEITTVNLMSLMGDNGAQLKQRQKEREQKREERKAQGISDEEIAKLEAEEDAQAEQETLQKSTGNTLQDLENRVNNESEALLADVRAADSKFENEQHRHAELARMRHEERQASQENTFQPSALVLGLAQARQINLDSSSKQDQDRQKQLARQRLVTWQQKDQSEMDKVKEELKYLETGTKPEPVSSPNIGALQEAVLKEMERKHLCEMLVMERLISEEKESELRKATQQLSKEQQQERLFELKEMRKQWRESGSEEMTEAADEQEAILREGVGLKLELSREELGQKAAEEGKELGPDDNAVTLLAALQQHQEQEAEYLMRDLAVKNPMVLKQLQSVHAMACQERWYDNLAACVLGLKRTQARTAAEESPEQELVEALEQKYDALKDKLLTEALMKQMGDAEWAALSERERQAKLLKLKLQERRLRQEGKLDEASRLLGEGMKHDAALRALMGESKAQQKQRLQERLEQLRKLKQEGGEVDEGQMAALEQVEAEGVDAVDAEVLNQLIEETMTETEEVTTSTLLNDLSSQFEEEKEALLRALRDQDERFGNERKRQLELAKLRREQRRLKQEDNFDTAAILLGLAKQERAAKEASYEKDRARQEQLARERIAAMKARRAAKREKSEEEAQKELEEKLLKEQAEDSEIDARNALDIEQGGLAQLQEAILNEVEKKHLSEQEALTDLLAKAEEDQEALAAARYLTESERKNRVDEIATERKAWRMDAVRDAMQAIPDDLQTEEEKKMNATRIAESRAKHTKLLSNALVLQIEMKRAQLLSNGIDEDKLQDEISVLLMADLQQKQAVESNAVGNVLGDKDESVLARVKTDQRMARREGWMDNLAATLMGSRPMRKRSTTMTSSSAMSNLAEGDEEEARLEEEQEEELAEMEKEMEKEKEARKLAGATDEEIQKALELLHRQHDAKRKAMADAVEKQRQMTRQRLEEKRRKREEQQYEEDMAASIVTMAEKRNALIREKTMLRREGHKDALNERLARRRAEREKKKVEEEEARRKQEEEEESKRKAEQEAKKGEEPKKAQDWPLPPGFAMKREKTVIDVEVSEEKQKEIVSSLLREHTNVGMKFERERTRQEAMLRARKERKKNKIEKKQEEVATILGLGERQKTFVEQQKKEERERQITMVRERIARVRHERTMTMREPKDEKAQGFESLLTEEEKAGLSEEEKMKRIAAKMEEKFKNEQRRASTVAALAPPGQSLNTSSAEASEDEGAHPERSSQILDEKSRQKKLKERMASRKRERRRSIAPVPDEAGATGGAD